MSERYIWHEEDFPAEGEVAQIQAVLLTADGRVLVRIKNGEARLAGGRPELEDTSLEETLRREVLEEANVEIYKIAYLGYQEAISDLDGEEEIALQSRMVALVTEILSAQPDPDSDNTWTYGRELLPRGQATAAYVKSFGEIGQILIDSAYARAEELGYFTETRSEVAEVINPEVRDRRAHTH